MILNQVQRRQKQEEDEHLESHTQNTDKDVFNMSNDEYYAPKNTHRAIGSGAAIQHSIPAQNIHHAFFPTHLDNYVSLFLLFTCSTLIFVFLESTSFESTATV
jgi:hypothetical protein